MAEFLCSYRLSDAGKAAGDGAAAKQSFALSEDTFNN